MTNSINEEFTNKIAMFYPINQDKTNTAPIFYFDYDNLPSVSVIQFSIGLTGISTNEHYILRVNIINDSGDEIIKTDTSIDVSQLGLTKDKYLTEYLASASFVLTPPHFTVGTQQHIYNVKAFLLDINGKLLDENHTWFVTRKTDDLPDVINSEIS